LDFGVGVLILNASERLLCAEIRNNVPEKTLDSCELPPGGRENQLKLGDVDTACFRTDELAIKVTAVKNFYCVYRALSCLVNTMLGCRSKEMKRVRTSDLPR
jgi:hypothetical protein